MQYVKPELNVITFELEDVLTSSAVVHTTTQPSTTLPGTTSVGGAQIGPGDVIVDFSDFYK